LAPAFAGQGLPSGCLGNASCGRPGFPGCCRQRGFAYASGLTVTYSALLDRLLALEALAHPGETRQCTQPNSDTTNLSSCADLWRVRRRHNDESLAGVMATMGATNTSYFLQAVAPDGERYGEYAARPACAVDAADGCPVQQRHGYFETSPNVDAIALRTVPPEVGSWMVVGGWWLVVGGWWLVVGWLR
jgi:hypothetical protein